jgi:tetratricopeptide (TPR) repeat protein
MNRESLVVGAAGIVFGLLVGWIIGSQNVRTLPAEPARVESAAPQTNAAPAPQPAPLDEAQVKSLQSAAQANAKDAAVRRRLGDLYFDAERYAEAIRWYEASLEIDPKNPDVSTDLGVSYYYSNQPDRALGQFDRSLQIDPKHTKTLLNVGVVRASAKRDLSGAMEAWKQVLALAPDSPEGRAARQLLETLQPDHGGAAAGAPGPAKGGA